MEAKKSIMVNVDLQNPNELNALPDLSDIQLWCEKSIQTDACNKAFENSLSVLIRVVDSAESESLNTNIGRKKGLRMYFHFQMICLSLCLIFLSLHYKTAFWVI